MPRRSSSSSSRSHILRSIRWEMLKKAHNEEVEDGNPVNLNPRRHHSETTTPSSLIVQALRNEDGSMVSSLTKPPPYEREECLGLHMMWVSTASGLCCLVTYSVILGMVLGRELLKRKPLPLQQRSNMGVNIVNASMQDDVIASIQDQESNPYYSIEDGNDMDIFQGDSEAAYYAYIDSISAEDLTDQNQFNTTSPIFFEASYTTTPPTTTLDAKDEDAGMMALMFGFVSLLVAIHLIGFSLVMEYQKRAAMTQNTDEDDFELGIATAAHQSPLQRYLR